MKMPSMPAATLGGDDSWSIKTEILSGLTVALALVPEAVAFAIIAGVEPLVGLYAAFMVGLLAAVFGGRPGMISGATGAMAIVMVALVADQEAKGQNGLEFLLATVVLTGLIQICVGVLHLGKYIRIVPHPVMLGFVNGLAIVIFLAQMEQFKHKPEGVEHEIWMTGTPMFLFLGLIAATMAIIVLLPKITKIIPSSLAAIVAISLVVIGFNLDTKTVGDIASIEGGLPSFHYPQVAWTLENLMIILPYAITLAAVGLIESLLTDSSDVDQTASQTPAESDPVETDGVAENDQDSSLVEEDSSLIGSLMDDTETSTDSIPEQVETEQDKPKQPKADVDLGVIGSLLDDADDQNESQGKES